jgi:ribosomal protein S18 acetylase RimI-like enzyme
MVVFCDADRLEFEEYVDFLKRCDLGSQYPKQHFENRIRTLLKNTDIYITARNQKGLLIGICFGITDFAYFLFLTDLGVDRDYTGQGIGTKLLSLAHQKAGGEDDITITTISNENAIGFYETCGLRSKKELVVKYCREWEEFVVT